MFTGIITDVGTVRSVDRPSDVRIAIETRFDTATIPLGASIACSGPCLTVVEKGPGWFAVNVSTETLSKTTLGDWRPRQRINLERSLRVGDELGGHLVSGHVDGVATLVSRRPEAGSVRMTFAAPASLARYIAPKGAVAIDGTSLTVNEVDGVNFGVNIIPHTLQVTTFGDLQPGARVNIEVDVLARYVDRLRQMA
ncbi:MAG: riboflavin synthase [Alphaproteobacteria bacterium]|nr:riboflavin synthase [Alphaproteobacteria bacterium]